MRSLDALEAHPISLLIPPPSPGTAGKDCTLLLHLLMAARYKYAQDHPALVLAPLACLYVTGRFPFPEVEAFVRACVPRYHLHLTAVCTDSMKEALTAFLAPASPGGPVRFQAVVIGNRRTDPHSHHLQPILPTDGDWPRVLRVHPLLDWRYRDIWRAMCALNIPYCPLYDQG